MRWILLCRQLPLFKIFKQHLLVCNNYVICQICLPLVTDIFMSDNFKRYENIDIDLDIDSF